MNDKQRFPLFATIGFFDGVHLGHRYLLCQLLDSARAAGARSMVITFDRHPRQVVQMGFQPELLSTVEERRQWILETGVDRCEVLHFDQRLSQLSAKDFMRQVLRDLLGVDRLFVGYDNRFGHDRTEGFDDYVRYGEEMGMEVVKSGEKGGLSSSVIRQYLKEGDVERAASSLGRPYTLSGRVVNGYHEGRKLGFPTANIDVSPSGKLVPAAGVYAVDVWTEASSAPYRGMMNIGTRPTFDGNGQTIEVHLLGFNGDLYNQTLTVAFLRRIREERKFSSIEELVRQLEIDRKEIEI